MARTQQNRRKTQEGMFSKSSMQAAVEEVVKNILNIWKAAEKFGLSFKTVARYVKKVKESSDGDQPAVKMIANFYHRLVFPRKLEEMLTEYLIERAKVLARISDF